MRQTLPRPSASSTSECPWSAATGRPLTSCGVASSVKQVLMHTRRHLVLTLTRWSANTCWVSTQPLLTSTLPPTPSGNPIGVISKRTTTCQCARSFLTTAISMTARTGTAPTARRPARHWQTQTATRAAATLETQHRAAGGDDTECHRRMHTCTCAFLAPHFHCLARVPSGARTSKLCS
jgi:hypothetical protein